jgi:hypothetical protein
LVRTEKKGRVRTCAIERDALAGAEAWISTRRAMWERHFDRLGEFLVEGASEPKKRKRKS